MQRKKKGTGARETWCHDVAWPTGSGERPGIRNWGDELKKDGGKNEGALGRGEKRQNEERKKQKRRWRKERILVRIGKKGNNSL